MEQVLNNQNNSQTANPTETFNAQKEISDLKFKIEALEKRMNKASDNFGGRF